MKYCTTCKELELDDSKDVCPKCGHPFIELATQQESSGCAFCEYLEEMERKDDDLD